VICSVCGIGGHILGSLGWCGHLPVRWDQFWEECSLRRCLGDGVFISTVCHVENLRELLLMYAVPITGTVFILLCIYLHLDNPKTPVWEGLKAVDWAGSLSIVGGTLMLLLGLEFGGVTYPWNSAKVICLIVFGVVVAGLFVLNEWKFARYPVMPLRLFKHTSNIASLGVCFCHGYVFIAGSYYLPLYFQAVLGATPLLSGVYLLPFALSLSFASVPTGLFIKKTGRYLPPIWFGLFFMALGFGLFIDLGAKRNWAKIIIFEIVAGMGVGPNFQAPLIALQTLVPRLSLSLSVALSSRTRCRNAIHR
jgi:hypothetical protein